jgi:hypothetical protein
MKPFLFKTSRGYGHGRTSLLSEDRTMKNPDMNEPTLLALSPLGVANDKDRKSPRQWLAASLSVLCLSMGFASAASAKDVYLQAQRYDKIINLPNPDGVIPEPTDTVPMWGFASCADDPATTTVDNFEVCTLDPDAAGPRITADISGGDTALTIHLINTLTAPVSIVIPGQLGGGDPVMVTDAAGRTRMQSMTHEAAASVDGITPSAEVTYSWPNLKTGTFLIHSGTQPSLQVPMGLYGALTVTNGADAYAGVTPDSDYLMLMSEVDPVQNRRVVASTFPTANAEKCVPMADFKTNATVGYPCTIDYNPIYLLVNGQATQASVPQITNGTAAQTVLMRFVNAGLRTHTPAFAGLQLSIVAEDGNKLPGKAHTQDSALLTAGKTIDALVDAPLADTTETGVTWSLYDHMSSFNNEAGANGGAVASFNIGSGTPVIDTSGLPHAVEDTYAVTEDTMLTATTSVLENDIGLTNPTAAVSIKPVNGELVWNADGTFTYTPAANFSGTDTFVYNAIDSADGQAYSAVVTLNVSFVNDAPIAAADAYSNALGTAITVDAYRGVLGNDQDADGDTLSVVIPTSGIVSTNGVPVAMSADGSFTYTMSTSPTSVTTDTFTYQATDSVGGTSDPVTVTLTVAPASGINLTVQEFGTNALIDSYRWIVQEDNTYHLDATNPQTTPPLQQQALNLHKSTMTVVAQGCVNCQALDGTALPSKQLSEVALDPDKYYYVSVLPNDAVSFDPAGNRLAGHTIGGTQIKPGDTAVTAIVNPQEIPTAQIAVEVFQDTAPTNGAIDGGEAGVGGFTITLEDGGGRYGMSAGIMFQDTYGNPLKNYLTCFGPDGDQPYEAVATDGASLIETCPDNDVNRAAGLVGHALIKNLAPGKYGVIAVPPASEKSWVQTSTIEGTKIIDAWVKAGEPAYFNEFGLVGPHAFIGFTRPETTCIGDSNSGCQVTGTPGTHTVTGKITALHDPKPPLPMLSVNADNAEFFNATRFWVGLNSDAGNGPSIATIETNEDGSFSIPNVPNGSYQVVVWDIYLDAIISYFAVDVTDGDVNLVVTNGDTQGVPAWFTRSEHNVFLDDGCGAGPTDSRYGNGIRDLCDDGITMEEGLQEQAVNIRWRDGTMNQSFPTDSTGFVPFDEAFPFFSWQLYEIDYLRYRPTGVTVTVDKGGPLAPGEFISPQEQEPALFTADNEACTDATCLTRTETGPVLLEAFQSLPGQTLLFDWGKVPYQPGENGGIAGIVSYATTRAEWDPRLTVMEPWEPGIANVKVRLYRVVQREDGSEALSLLKEVMTDSWDAAPPTGCQGETDLADPYIAQTLGTSDAERSRCIDGFRGWNQARPGVFDGGYAFMTIPDPNNPGEEMPIPPGKYVVEAVLPPGYEQYKEEDMNVTMGDARTGDTTGVAPVSVTLPTGSLVLILPDKAMVQAAFKEPGLLQPPCVGQDHIVPDELSLFPGEAAPFAGATRQLCNRKLVVLSDQSQAAADFHFFTSTPVAAQYTGLITDDLSMETNPASPMMGEKFAPAYMPYSIRDYNGNVVYSGLGDGWGRYNGLVPSTFSASIPMPSGYSPAMMQACLNDAGPTMNARYLSACVTGQFMPGTNTYLDTPILPQSAFAGGFNPPDCALPVGTPVITSVNNDNGDFGPLVAPGETLVINSAGPGAVIPNPNYEGPLATNTAANPTANQPTTTRDLGFGPAGGPTGRGTVELVGNGTSYELTVPNGGNGWNPNQINATVPDGTGGTIAVPPGTYQLVVTRNGSGISSTNAVTVTVADPTAAGYVAPIRVPGDQATIQAAIDAATPGDLILVGPGTYNERVIMWKPVRLQGVGTDTVIDGLQTTSTVLDDWYAVLDQHVPNPASAVQPTPEGLVDLLPGQTTLDTDGATITVLGRGPDHCDGGVCYKDNPSRIDGFTITHGANGGGILVHAWADNLEISNNTVTANSGQFSGGIRVGMPNLPAVEALLGQGIMDFNSNVNIHNNAVALNGAIHMESAGGGVSMNYGSTNYTVASNFICGNYTNGEGAGIGHLGVSNGGQILSNTILFNQAYNLSFTTNGGGILVAGESLAGTLSNGSGDVTIAGNLIKANHAASGHGGGIRLQYVNGTEIAPATADTPAVPAWQITISGNKVVNNVAGWSGAGISLLNAVNAHIDGNTVANNDSTATEGSLVVNNSSSPAQPSGIVAMSHSLNLPSVLTGTTYNTVYSAPASLDGNFIYHNRSFHLGEGTDGNGNAIVTLLPQLSPGTVGACASGAEYQDLGVLPAGTGVLNPTNPVTLAVTGEYCNGARSSTTPGPIEVYLGTGEGGNFADVRFGPLVDMGSYPLP